MNGEVGWSSLEIRFKNTKNPICIYLLWRSNDFNAMFVKTWKQVTQRSINILESPIKMSQSFKGY